MAKAAQRGVQQHSVDYWRSASATHPDLNNLDDLNEDDVDASSLSACLAVGEAVEYVDLDRYEDREAAREKDTTTSDRSQRRASFA